jgi:hypothetical protein
VMIALPKRFSLNNTEQAKRRYEVSLIYIRYRVRGTGQTLGRFVQLDDDMPNDSSPAC